MGEDGVSPYQAFAFLWHLDRSDMHAAQLVIHLPPAFFAPFDAVLQAAFTYGASMQAITTN